ncbi:MAG: WecB/TagA/CpsF family glycosyltransferase, partial [Patescibacteria group bacterium]
SKASDISTALKNIYPQLQFEVWDIDRTDKNWKAKPTNAKIMFVTLGAPYQEKFIFHHMAQMPTIKVALGVGGSFDFLTGKIKRAPKIMRRLGIEWLYRIFSQPINRQKRLKRIYRATFIFVLKIINWRFILPFKYRPNVACLLYRIKNNETQILLVERTDEPGHWQIPQGGIDGLDLKGAAIKELSEELNNNKFTIQAIFKNLYRYKNNHIYNHCAKHTGYKGQKQSLAIAEFNGEEADIKINFWEHLNYKWVPSDELITASHPLRKTGYQIYLEKFKEII